MPNEEMIRDGERITAFLNDPVIENALKRVTDRAFADFRNAKTDDDLRAARALLVAGERFEEALRGVTSLGKRHKIEKDREELARRQPAASRF